ncbi:alpha/beta hydrolase [Pseudothermotoga sp.]
MRFSELFLSIFRRRLLLIAVLVVVAVVAAIFLWRFFGNRRIVLSGTREETSVPLSIVVPDGAYGVRKTFVVKRVPRETLSQTISSVFVGDLYDVFPSDGVDEFAMRPIRIVYRLPKDLYLGAEYANVRLAYVPDPTQPVYRIFGGASIGLDEKGPYVEAQAFHTSMIGLIADVPEKQKLGLQLLIERSKSTEPVLLLVPDVDRGFLGFVNSSQGSANFWVELFPNRTVMYYDYPVAGTRSNSYMNSFRSFAQKNIPSYLLFEAEKLAMELVRLRNFEFDIVAHGIGAIVARLAVELNPQVKNVRSLVLVSPPNKGTNVVNPLYYGALLYRKDSQVVANNFGIDRFVVDAMKSHLLYYLEALGPVYEEILTGSELLKKLDGTARKDVRYLVAVGSSPPASIDVGGTQLEVFYPELVAGKGDGVVSHTSAFLEVGQRLVLKGSFFDCYLDPTFHDALKKFLAETRIEVPKYKEETYPERSPQAQQTERIVKPEQTSQATPAQTKKEETVQARVSLPTKFQRSELLTKVEILNLSGVLSVHFTLSRLFYVLKDGLYSDGKRLHPGNVRCVHAHKSGVGFVSDDRVYFFDGVKLVERAKIDTANVEDVLVTENGVFALVRAKDGFAFARWENGWKVVQNVSGVYGRFVDGPSTLLMTNREIYEFSQGKLTKLLDASKLSIEGRSVDFTSCLLAFDLLLVGLRSYSLVVYDVKSGTYVWGAEGWIDPKEFLLLDNTVLIFGTFSLFVFDLSKLNLRSTYHSFPAAVEGVTVGADKIYILSQSRVEVYKLK